MIRVSSSTGMIVHSGGLVNLLMFLGYAHLLGEFDLDTLTCALQTDAGLVLGEYVLQAA